MSAPTIDDLKERITADYLFAHRILFSHTHANLDAPFHKDLIKLLHGQDEQVVFLCFRNGAKSAISEEAIAIGALTRAWNYSVIVCSTERRACDRLLAISNALERNEVIEELYGDVRGDTWHSTRLVLKNGVCIDAIGAGSNTRGMRYLSSRPEFAFMDDIEEQSATSMDNVSTPEKRDELMWWFRSFVPSLAEPYKLRIAGTALHASSLIMSCVKSDSFKALVVPIGTISPDTGERVASWPDEFPLSWIDKSRAEADSYGQRETWAQEYMCQASVPGARSFQDHMFRFEDRPRTWEPAYVIYDPARTAVPGKSCATGKVAASWIGGKLLVWEATQAFWQPDEIINDMFEANAKYSPIQIGFEETGLNQWAMQPLRQAQAARGSIPLRAVNPPRGPGKENLLLGLQPYFAAGEVVFMGERARFQKLIDELLGFPYGLKDTINALAYMLEIKPGEAIFSRFRNEHVVDSFQPSRRATSYLLLNSDGLWSCAVLVASVDEGLRVLADWCDEGGLAEVVPANIRLARARAGRDLVCYAPQVHWKPYDPIGLRPAASSAGQTVLQGGDLTAGQAEIRRLLAFRLGDEQLFQVSRAASWTLRAMSGGYAKEPDKTAAMPGPYKVVGEALECFAAVLATIGPDDSEPNAVTPDGRHYFSSMPYRVRAARNREERAR